MRNVRKAQNSNMKSLKKKSRNARSHKGPLRLILAAIASTCVHLLRRASTIAKRHKHALIIASIILAGGAIAATFYINRSLKVRSYYIAYIGRHQGDQFDQLHEVTLLKYLDELNADLKGVKLELKLFNTGGEVAKSKQIYEEISHDNEFVVVIDNTWGSDLQLASDFIRENKIPVIAINADKQTEDFGKNVVFLGHDDFVPKTVTNFSMNILAAKHIIFVAELGENFASTNAFDEEFKRSGAEVTRFSVRSRKFDSQELEVLLNNLDLEVKQRLQRKESPTIIINTHAAWGAKIVKHLDETANGVTIVGGPYISDVSDVNAFGQTNKDNHLIMLTSPVDVVTKKLYYDLKEISITKPEATKILNAQLFVKRCLDAVSVIRGVLIDEAGHSTKAAISKSDFTIFFQNKLAASDYISKYDLYSFDKDLLVSDDKTFEEHTQGEKSSYPKQLNSLGEIIPNVYFGIEIINVSNIDLTNRSFHADFFYWLKYDKNYPNVDQFIRFRNENKQDASPDTALTDTSGSSIYKLYKKSADFSIDANFTKYPFDVQELKIELAVIMPSDRVLISFDHAGFNDSKKRAQEFSLNDWYMEDFYVSVDNFIATSSRGGPGLISKQPRKFKTLTVRMPVHRRLTGPFVTIILPLIMIGFAAIAVLYIRDNTFGYIGEVSSAIFLSIVAYSIGFADLTPRSNILTTADMLFYFTFFTVFLVFLKVILFNSNMISERVRSRASGRATLIGFTALTVYCLTVGVILISGLT